MARDPTTVALRQLDDPDKWVVVENVPIFTEHIRRDREGRVLYEVGEAELREICDATRDIEVEYAVVPKLMIGHTRIDCPETDQSPIVGYARNLRVGTWGPAKKLAILADFYYRRDDWPIAQKFPFRSVEYYPSRKQIAGIALLERDPELDMGMLIFEKDDLVYYNRWDMTDSSPSSSPHTSNASYSEGSGASKSVPQSLAVKSKESYEARVDAMWEHYCRHFAEAYAAHGKLPNPIFSPEHYASREESSRPSVPPSSGISSSASASDRVVMPEQKSYAAGPGTAGPDNAYVPQPVSVAGPSSPSSSPSSHMQREEEAIRYAQHEARVVALERELEQVRYEKRMARAEQIVTQLQGEGYQIRSRETLVNRLVRLADDDVTAAVAEVRENYTRVPLEQRFIRLADTAPPNGKSITPEQHRAAISLATREKIGYDEAMKKVQGATA